MWASIQRPVQRAAAGPRQMVSKVRKSRSILGSPLPTVGQNGATAPVAATAHYLKLTSRLWFVQLIFRSNDRVAFWGSDVISKLVSNVILFYFIFLRSRISGFWMGFLVKISELFPVIETLWAEYRAGKPEASLVPAGRCFRHYDSRRLLVGTPSSCLLSESLLIDKEGKKIII